MPQYIAVISLNTPGGLIRAGEKVPANYARIEDGLRRGWIRKVNGEGETKPMPTPEAATVGPDATEEPITDTTDETPSDGDESTGDTEETGEEAEEESGDLDAPEVTLSSKVEALGFLAPPVIEGLDELGIVLVADLGGKEVEDLTVVKGIGRATATQLISSYQAIAGE